MRTIVLANQKGGCCKTTTASTLAHGLYQRGYTVLCVDLDPQSNLTFGFGGDVMGTVSLYDVFRGQASTGDILQHIRISGLDLITGGLNLSAADMEFTQTGREYMLRECLEDMQDDYDYCIIDTAPTLGILTVNALTAADMVIIPLTPDAFAIQGLGQLNLLIERVRKYSNRNLQIAGLLVTKYDDRTNITKSLMERIHSSAGKLGTRVFKQPIRKSVAVREVQLFQSDIFSEAPKSNAAKDYNSFMDELLELLADDGKEN